MRIYHYSNNDLVIYLKEKLRRRPKCTRGLPLNKITELYTQSSLLNVLLNVRTMFFYFQAFSEYFGNLSPYIQVNKQICLLQFEQRMLKIIYNIEFASKY